MLFVVGFHLSSIAQCNPCTECESGISAPVPYEFLQPFFNNETVAMGGPTSMTLLAGANNAHVGAIWNVGSSVAGTNNDDLCISGEFTLSTDDATVFPVLLEFRIENNNCGISPCPWLSFDIAIPSNGTYSVDQILTSGIVGASGVFDPTGANPAIVVALANYSGTPLPADVTVTYSNISLLDYDCMLLANAPDECSEAGTGGGMGGEGNIPTVGEWGLLSLTIFFLTTGLVFIRSRETSQLLEEF